MTDHSTEVLDLYLNDINHFFQDPQIDPFLGENIGASGVNRLIDAMNARSRRDRNIGTVAVHLPDAEIVPGLEERLTAAIADYCDAQIGVASQKKREVRLAGLTALRIGLVCWAICLAISVLFEKLLADRLLGRLLGEGFIIAGWVCLWHPAELLLYEWRPHARAVKRYKQIKSMDIRLVPAPPRQAGTLP